MIILNKTISIIGSCKDIKNQGCGIKKWMKTKLSHKDTKSPKFTKYFINFNTPDCHAECLSLVYRRGVKTILFLFNIDSEFSNFDILLEQTIDIFTLFSSSLKCLIKVHINTHRIISKTYIKSEVHARLNFKSITKAIVRQPIVKTSNTFSNRAYPSPGNQSVPA